MKGIQTGSQERDRPGVNPGRTSISKHPERRKQDEKKTQCKESVCNHSLTPKPLNHLNRDRGKQVLGHNQGFDLGKQKHQIEMGGILQRGEKKRVLFLLSMTGERRSSGRSAVDDLEFFYITLDKKFLLPTIGLTVWGPTC